MVVVAQGDIWWADLAEPAGSEPGFRRPIIIVQGESLNRSRIATVIVVPLTSNMEWAGAPGNVALPAESTGLPKDSVANVSQLMTLDRQVLIERVGRLSQSKMELVLAGIDLVLGR
jgi:mRNA interferase MazF